MKFLIATFFIMCLMACSQSADKSRNVEDSAIINTAIKKDSSYLKHVGDSILIPAFNIEVSLSKKAEEKLLEKKETIIVAAYFIGKPKDTVSIQYKKTGELGLTSKNILLTGGIRKASFENVKFSDALFNSLEDKDINVLINVYSGRQSITDNFLDCDIYEGKLSAIMNKTYTIKGKLIGE